MIILKSPREIEVLRRAGGLVGRFFEEVRPLISAGVSTMDLEECAVAYLERNSVKGAFKGYMGYPANLCTSVNEEVVHGIPSPKRVLRDGDIVSIDFGVFFEGYCGDAARTFPVGKIEGIFERLIASTENSLAKGIEKCVVGNRLGDLSSAVQNAVEADGFSVVRDFVGHGIGRQMHEEPQVPNFGSPGSGPRLLEGMVLAIEPMVNEGGWGVEILKDGWTVVTRDRKRSAHFEHMVAITKDGPEILTLP
jgi:methionyl aminopeptidase